MGRKPVHSGLIIIRYTDPGS